MLVLIFISGGQMHDRTYQAVATVHDPLTDKGMKEEPVHDRVNLDRIKALKLAKLWSEQGYWCSIYNQLTAECVECYAPKRG
jgi:hypothetical protein